jgi:hypothetical protein
VKTTFTNITNENSIPWWGAAIAALLALWMIFQSRGIINNDGILYIEAAKQFANHEWRTGFALYNWPLYPLIIALAHSVTGLEFQTSAHAISIIFFALTGAGITVLVREFGGDRRVMMAAILLLCSSPYLVRSLLPMVIRDHGFLTLHIWSLIFFLRFYRDNTLKYAIGWGGTAIIATLFRIEGIIYLALLPLIILTSNTLPWIKRFELMLKAQALPLALGIFMLALLISSPLSLNDLGRLKDPISLAKTMLFQLSQGLSGKAEIYGNHVLGPFLDDFSLAGLMATLILVTVIKSAGSAGWLQFAFAAFCAKLPENQLPASRPVLKWLYFLGLAIAIVILLSVFVLSTRYLLPLATLILVAGAFGLKALFQTIENKWIQNGLIAIIVLQVAATLWPFHSSNHYEIEASEWIKDHIAPDKNIYFDEGRLRYYALNNSSDRTKKPWTEVQRVLDSNELKRFDYVIVHVSQNHPQQQAWIKQKLGTPIVTFTNRHGKQVQIHEIH